MNPPDKSNPYAPRDPFGPAETPQRGLAEHPRNPRPEMTEKELSRHVAVAGLEAQAEAAHLPGDPAQVAAVQAEAQRQTPEAHANPFQVVCGVAFPERMTLSLALDLGSLSDKLKGRPDLETVAALAAFLHQTATGTPPDLSDPNLPDALVASGLKLAGGWSVAEIDAFTAYLKELNGAPRGKPEAAPAAA